MKDVFLCWDIDGTLLSTARAGVYALEKATLAMTGWPLDLQAMPTAGFTDVEIARQILERAGRNQSGAVEEFLLIYEEALPSALHRRTGKVMPGVIEVLDDLRCRPDWGSILLTGNTRRGAEAKLRHYGLDGYFDFAAGAFSDGTVNRAEIALRAVKLIQARQPSLPCGRIIVIGDTPYDIACARAAGVRCLAIANGGHSVESLHQHTPDAVVEQLPVPARFVELVLSICK
jgi:phosphoglycolate phosphatase